MNRPQSPRSERAIKRARHPALPALVLAISALGAIAARAAPAGDPLLVSTSGGVVRGRLGSGVREFKGIPFAAPPLAELRWQPPAPPAPWQGVRDATTFRGACPQVSRYNLTEASDAEDCLYLNVASPARPAPRGAPRPVIVWIHGGAFVGGSANLYPLDYLARRADVVVVSINYRLGVFGFLAHPAFAPEHNAGYALEDQRAALRWVQRNIAAFGGDPANVTVAGESAGAASICMQLSAPEEANGLFHRAIIQSSGCVRRLRTVTESFATGVKVAAAVGCAEPATALACLRSKPVRTLVEAATAVAGADLLAFAPSVGSRSLPQQGQDALASGRFVRVPLINGGTRDEMRLYVGYDVVAGRKVTLDNYADRIGALYGEHASAVLREYPAAAYSSPATALGTAMSDFMPGIGLSNCHFLRTAQLAARYVPVYQYEFADRDAPPVMPDPGFELGAVHSAELPYEFPHFSNKSVYDGPDLTAPSQRLAEQIVAYFSAFARSGRPAAPHLPAWRRFRSGRDVMRFEPGKLGLFNAAAEHRCAFWRTLYPGVLGP